MNTHRLGSWIGVDLDGTLADHYWPREPYHPLKIGAPIPAMVERIKGWLGEGREVRIFTARVGVIGSAPAEVLPPEGESIEEIRNAIEQWCVEVFGRTLEVTAQKDYGMVELWDDRAVRVVCNTGERCCNG